MSFVVISPPHDMDCKELHTYLLANTNLKPSKCVLEFGKAGDHPHLNYVCADEPSYVELMSDLESYVRTQYYPCGQRRRMTAAMRKNILQIKMIYDSASLDNYLSKESKSEVLSCGEGIPEVQVEWEFKWLDAQKGENFSHHLLVNIRNWLSNYPIIQTWKILTSHNKYDKELRKMLFATGHTGMLLKYNGLRYDQRMAILQTLRTELKITDPLD